MNVDSIIQLAVPIVAVASGWSIGRRGMSRQTIDMLQIQVETLERGIGHKETELVDLRSRVEVLEGLVTQRAAVDEVREIVERIADRVGA